MQYEDISERQSDESTQDNVAPKEDDLSNSNDNDSDIEEKK